MLDTINNSTPLLLEFDNVTIRRGSTYALQNVSLSVTSDENVAIIGPNGSGKSTLIKTITRDCYPQLDSNGSSVKILGETVWDVHCLRSMLGIVSSDLQQMCDRRITGREMVLSGYFSSIGIYPHQYVTNDMRLAVEEVLELLEIASLGDRYMTDMSTGQARRMLIARALVHNPKALILDEPTSSLDPYASRKFLKSLSKITHTGRSIIMVTHHLHNIIPETDRIIMIKEGKVFADGSKGEMMDKDLLSELFSMHVEIQEKAGYYYLLV